MSVDGAAGILIVHWQYSSPGAEINCYELISYHPFYFNLCGTVKEKAANS